MRSPALAVAWEFRQRHRLGLIALSGYLLVLAMLKLLRSGQPVRFQDAQSFALTVVVPLASTFIYLLAVFTFGLSGDIAARQSMYPARKFTLPVTTGALAGWPMVYGTAAMTILWFATRALAIWPSDAHVPVIWPALLAASLLAWTQALTWMPYGLPGLRVVVAVLWLAFIDGVVLVALSSNVSEGVMLAILAPHLPLAYVVARFGVGRARRGEVPDWRGVFARLAHVADVLRPGGREFRSAARAQEWFEWRMHGRSLPALVAILLPFELSMLFVFRETPVIVLETVVIVLFTPPFMASFVAATVGKAARDSHGLTALIATRPLTDASLIAAKLRATVRSTIASWMLVAVAVPLALWLSGTSAVVMERAQRLVEIMGPPRAVAIMLLGVAALLVTTWKQLVQNLYIGMSGREWLVKASVFAALSFLAIVFPLAHWIFTDRRAMAFVWNGVPWMLAVLVCVKTFAGGWIAVRLHDLELVRDRSLLVGAVSWAVGVFALYGVLAWTFPELIVRHYLLALVAILAVPLARLSAAPLALAWNRHR